MRTWFEIIDDIKTLVEELDEKYRAELFKDIMLTIRPKGEWKQICWKPVIFREVEALHHYRCDNCDKEVRIDRIERYNYCPHCGAYMVADMRSEE